jgi:ParB family chromosome partitioning protein
MTKKKGLGRGLTALIGDGSPGQDAGGGVIQAPVDTISTNPYQPRSEVKDKDIKSLADSVKEKGVLTPLLVREIEPGRFELIAGERRLRAARAAGLASVPVVVRDASPVDRLELALIENIHRQDLNPIEEAESFRRLTEEFERTVEEMGRLTGRDRTTIVNTLRLLKLPSPVQDDVRRGRLTAGHARALLALGDEARIMAARAQVLSDALTVRATEALVKRMLKPPRKKPDPGSDAVYLDALADEMSRQLGSKVKLSRRGRQGKIEIAFGSNEELERLMDRLGVKPV